MTFMTTLTRPDFPFVFDCITGTNTGVDFAAFIRYLIAAGYLTAGDYLILDNAAVHLTNATAPLLLAELDQAGVRRTPFRAD
jgi:hypothetical protein